MKHRPDHPRQVSPELQQILDAAAAMTARGQEPRRHHLVPKFYLDRWAAGKQIRVTDLGQSRHSYVTAPSNALIETDYYRVPPESVQGGSPVFWEAWLSQIEGEASKVFTVIDDAGMEALDETQYARLLHFIGVQITRSRSFRFRGRWMMGPGFYQAYELYRPGSISAMLTRAGEKPTAERIAGVEAYFAAVNADPWKVPMLADEEMQLAIKAAADMAELLATRHLMVCRTAKPLLTCDEPIVQLHEDMGADHPQDGGYLRAPIVIFPFGPQQVLAMFRQDMPLPKGGNNTLNWGETLELNRAIVGNAHRHVIEGPSGKLGANLYVPDFKDPVRMVNMPPSDGSGPELLWMPAQKRWTGEQGAPFRPVASWWPPAVPLPPQPQAVPTV